jgi:hypothetical protein
MSLALFEFHIGQSFLRRTFSTVCDSNSPSLLLVMLRANILSTTNLFLSNISYLNNILRSRNFKYHLSLQKIPLQGITSSIVSFSGGLFSGDIVHNFG